MIGEIPAGGLLGFLFFICTRRGIPGSTCVGYLVGSWVGYADLSSFSLNFPNQQKRKIHSLTRILLATDAKCSK